MPEFTGIDEYIFLAALFVATTFLSWLGRLFMNGMVFILKWLWRLVIRLVVRSKRSFIIFNHARNHRLPTPVHNDPLFVCMDNPCDTLFVDAQALGVPSEAAGFLDNK